MKKNSNISVNVNAVVNYAMAHAGARAMKLASQSINQARKSMGGISKELLYLGMNKETKEKMYTSVEKFMESVGCPLSGGQVPLSAIKSAWSDFLKDAKGNLMICGNVPQRVKIGKKSYRLYVRNDEGEYKPLSIWAPREVGDNKWDSYKICEGLAQSAFSDETRAMVEKSKDEARSWGHYYVENELTGEYVEVKTEWTAKEEAA
jgi:hypothetical protein